MRTFAVVDMKGGVGKTTTAVQLAAGWARAGRRVLLVDALMLGEVAFADTVARAVRPGLDAITATPAAFTLDVQLAGVAQRETILTRRLHDLSGYDVVIVDTSPSLGLLAYNMLFFVGHLVVPVGMDSLAVNPQAHAARAAMAALEADAEFASRLFRPGICQCIRTDRYGGPRHGPPKPPRRSSRPGEPGTLLEIPGGSGRPSR